MIESDDSVRDSGPAPKMKTVSAPAPKVPFLPPKPSSKGRKGVVSTKKVIKLANAVKKVPAKGK